MYLGGSASHLRPCEVNYCRELCFRCHGIPSRALIRPVHRFRCEGVTSSATDGSLPVALPDRDRTYFQLPLYGTGVEEMRLGECPG